VTSVGIVIVNYNGGDVIVEALRCLELQTRRPERVVVIDNASEDGSVDVVAESFPWIELVRLERNVGFAAGNNVGIARLVGCEWVALLNPDAFAEPEWLARLVRAAEESPEYACFGSVLVDAAHTTVVDGTGDVYHVGGLAWRRDHGRRLDDVTHATPEVFGPCAAAALYRRDALISVGAFDERWFCYFEDVDLAFRLRLAGYRCAVVAASRARHVGSAITGRESSFTLYHSHRNMVWTWLRDMPLPLQVRSSPHFLATTVLAVAWYGSHGQLRTILRAKRDGFAALPWIVRERRALHASHAVSWQELRAVMARGASAYSSAAGRARRRPESPPVVEPLGDHAAAEPT
jgi:GT2 family glycosyltransferase